MSVTVNVRFGEHIPLERVQGMATGIATYGSLKGEGRNLSVEVLRLSRLPSLKDRLIQWEHYGFLRWSIDPEISN